MRRRRLDIDSELAEPIADILIQSMIDVFYQDGKHPKILRSNDGRPSTELVEEAYRLLFRFLKLSTVDGFSHEPPPPPDVFPNLDFPTPTDPSEEPPGEDDGGSFWDDLLDFILSIIAALAYIVQVAIYLATLPWAILADLITYPLRLALYYALELPLFHLLKMFRSVLVMTGYLMPMKDEIVQPLIRVGNPEDLTWTEVLDEVGDVFGALLEGPDDQPNRTFRDPRYPYAHPSDEFKHPWRYPTPDIPSELPALAASKGETGPTAGPHPRNAGPPVLFRLDQADPTIRDGLENARTPAEADAVGLQLEPFRHMGDAVDFSKYLIWLATRSDEAAAPIVDWNLDADRGYGYHCWDWNRHPLDGNSPRDPEDNAFGVPCTWPSQADDGLTPRSPGDPVQLHWVGPGLEDPGCEDTPPPPIG